MVTDPIADLLTRIRNAEMAGHNSCPIPYSKMKESILLILKKHEYISSFKIEGAGIEKLIQVDLNPSETIRRTYRRVSKPGQRIYKSVGDIRPVQNGLGIAVYSTSKGIMDNMDARRQKVGGELLCEIW